jgi:hypothetical protein
MKTLFLLSALVIVPIEASALPITLGPMNFLPPPLSVGPIPVTGSVTYSCRVSPLDCSLQVMFSGSAGSDSVFFDAGCFSASGCAGPFGLSEPLTGISAVGDLGGTLADLSGPVNIDGITTGDGNYFSLVCCAPAVSPTLQIFSPTSVLLANAILQAEVGASTYAVDQFGNEMGSFAIVSTPEPGTCDIVLLGILALGAFRLSAVHSDSARAKSC